MATTTDPENEQREATKPVIVPLQDINSGEHLRRCCVLSTAIADGFRPTPVMLIEITAWLTGAIVSCGVLS